MTIYDLFLVLMGGDEETAAARYIADQVSK